MSTEPTPAVHPFLATAFRTLDDAGVAWCLLRGDDDLASPPPDVDLLVRGADLPKAIRWLGGLGFVELPSWGRGSHRFFVAYDSVSDEWFKLDLVTRVEFGDIAPVDTGTDEPILAARMRRATLAVPADDDRFWLLALHCVLDRGNVPPRHAATLQGARERATVDGPLARWLAIAAGSHSAPSDLLAAAERGNWDEAVRIGGRARRRAGSGSRHGVLRGRLLRRLTKVRRLLLERGPSVALLGPDGAGKSTLIRDLRSNFYFPVRSVYMGLYGAGRDGASPPRSLPGRLVRLWGGYAAGMYHRARGRLVVFDRYSVDVLLGSPPSSVRGRIRRFLLRHAIPPPDLFLVLDAPAETLLARKDEQSLEEIEGQRRGYRALAADLEAPIVDVSRDLGSVRRTVTAAIWSLYQERHHRTRRRQ